MRVVHETVKADARAEWLARCVLPHEPALRAWLRRRENVMEVDDVVQETYAVLAGLPSVDQVHNPKAYMFQVAHNVVLQRLRRARVVRIDAVEEIDRLSIKHPGPSPEQLTSYRQELRQIARLIAALPAKCREAFMLRKIEGLSQREIAQRMGVSEGTVEKHVAKGVRILMDALGGTSGDGQQRSERTDVGKFDQRPHRRRRR